MKQELIDKITKAIEEAKCELSVDYLDYEPKPNDPFNISSVIEEVDGSLIDSVCDLETELREETISQFKDEIEEETGAEWSEISEEIFEIFAHVWPQVVVPMKEILSNAKVLSRINLYSNYDCINSSYLESAEGYSYEDSYFGHVVDQLNLNPAKLQRMMKKQGEITHGKWPNLPKRNGKEYVDYDRFFTYEVNQRTCGANLLCIPVIVNLGDVYEAFEGDQPDKIRVRIPEGSLIGFFSSFHGGGSAFSTPLLRDMDIELGKSLTGCKYDHWGLVEDSRGYGICETYGTDESSFNEIEVLKDEEIFVG